MEEVRGSPAASRRLSQILDPLARLASELGAPSSCTSTSSAPCSPRLGSGGSRLQQHSCCTGPPTSTSTSSGPSSLGASGSPRLMPRKGRQGPAVPPRPRNNNGPFASSGSSGPQGLVFTKDKSFNESARGAGYVELRDSPSPSPKLALANPYSFSSEPSGRVEYVDSATGVGTTGVGVRPELGIHDNNSASGSGYLDRLTNQQQQMLWSTEGMVRSGPQSLTLQQQDLESRSVGSGFGATTSGKSFDGYSNAVEELNWQERCLELQLELHRSRNQASRVRDMLREKVSDFT
ncbi:hypothetical protein QAD02_023990 [Eretmocerus hayati]|uniref:Uncharacterized protein n=1 Tax=Eretmocerus hayati TaxID=131215 RepID=A0ACC2PX65_9HYME|nr:hypothetical protein QAD02_023990 [Eretmocerus hayati]